MGIAQRDLTATFADQGFIVLRQFLEPEVIVGVRAELEAMVDEEAHRLHVAGRIQKLHEDAPFETRLARLYEHDVTRAPRRYRENLHRPGFFPLFFHARLLDLVEELLGPEIRLYPNYTVRPKFPQWEGHRVLWHQDGGYTGGDYASLRMVNVWTPLVPVSVANGCMQFIPGSHKLGPLPHESREHYLEIRQDVLDPLLPQAVDMETEPGDVLLFSNMLLHQGLRNTSDTIRWSVDWRYQDAGQSSGRRFEGHLARSRRDPGAVVQNAEDWARRTFEWAGRAG